MGKIPHKAGKRLPPPSNFLLLEKVGSGTFGEVRRARCTESWKTVALKTFRDNRKHVDEGFSPSVLREIKIQQRLNHPNVLGLNGVVQSTKLCTCSLLLDFSDNTLASLIASGIKSLDIPFTHNLAVQFFKGLSYIHSLNIIHRDIKPSNILVTSTGVLKIADFGNATTLTPTDNSFNDFNNMNIDNRANEIGININMSTSMIPYWYRAPELFDGPCRYGFEVDMWSAGCVLAEMVTLEPLFRGNSEQEQPIVINNLFGILSEVPFTSFSCTQNLSSILTKAAGARFCPKWLEIVISILSIDPKKRVCSSTVSHLLSKSLFKPISSSYMLSVDSTILSCNYDVEDYLNSCSDFVPNSKIPVM